MHVETLDRRTMTDADGRAVAALLVKVFPRRTFEERLEQLVGQWRDWRGPEAEFPRSVIVRDGDRVIAHAAAWPRTIGTREGEMTILALAQVCSDPARRGEKLGQAVVRAVFDAVDHGPFPHSLFQTSHAVRPFYEKLGAGLVTNRIVNSLGDDPQKNPFWDEVVMRYPAAKHWPAGDIDLRGPGY
jgi:predicted N-acetyltransferase YhbS